MSDLYDVLELCLQEMEKGTDIDTVLARYPKHAQELRPILEASVMAFQLAAPGPSPEVERRGRARVLQQAAQMREAQAQSSRRLWSVPLRRALVSLAVIGVLFISSTRLVQAASTTLPGDNLYPVKRTWEDVRVLFTFNSQARELLEVEHENERLEELNDLFEEGRSAQVDFAGIVMSQNGDLWQVSKIPVLIAAQTRLDEQPVRVGDAVRVRGHTQPGGTVIAERVDVLPAGIPLPSVEDDDQGPEVEQAGPNSEQHDSTDDNSSDGSQDDRSGQESSQPSESESKSREFSRDGVVDAVNGDILVVNGQSMDISDAKIEGTPKAGAKVKVEGYFDANGEFIVTKIEFEDGGSGEADSAEDNASPEDVNEDTNDNSGNSNDDNNEDDGDDDNSGDNDGDNSGSGGGGGDD